MCFFFFLGGGGGVCPAPPGAGVCGMKSCMLVTMKAGIATDIRELEACTL